MELLKGVVGVKNKDSIHFTAVICGLLREEIHHNTALRVLWGWFLVHFAPSGKQPFKIQGGVVKHQALQKIIAGLVAAGQNMGNTAACNGEDIGKLSLREIFCLQKLQKTTIHIPEFYFHKYKHSL